ncbi:glycerophosphodiester phosphodiesterase family protein [Herbiconiux sp. CPCC 203407]|uniref:Glycerophosphodiester phosphodiesterase family protein n=1 Tax=Herbiconiux oxytropis TaxID=2970915 RepID=A0AA42BUX7_9MICO|nr:glycerophosphodiester phosphodiesterase family protein [Herbiconiux oxytropis]MCS5721861.1 glycerophosphodiester phosphodiesterase family protein [Herbiconiux oxytropis]MCS5727387.1 glycerophosphodiester phosphodiesterase family protein [Herbiconiux oxytropis]
MARRRRADPGESAGRAGGGWFAPATPRILAHRGLALEVPENTIAAFEKAISAGAAYIETDVNATADGIAVAVHDPTLDRVAGRSDRIADLTLAELREVDLGGGGRFATLAEVLSAHPETRFNIDIKAEDAAAPAAAAILAAGALDRVLITSFSTKRRRATVDLLEQRPLGSRISEKQVAASASAREFVPALLAAKIGLVPLARLLLRHVDAVQIPQRIWRIRTTTPRTVRRLHAAGVEVHVWTINDPDEARHLLENGADGIVTDRVDLMLELVRTPP